MATDASDKIAFRLAATAEASTAIAGAVGPFAGVGMPEPMLTPFERASRGFPGAKATAEARATYLEEAATPQLNSTLRRALAGEFGSKPIILPASEVPVDTPQFRIFGSTESLILTNELAIERGWLLEMRNIKTGQEIPKEFATSPEAYLEKLISAGFPPKGRNANIYDHVIPETSTLQPMYRGSSVDPKIAAVFASKDSSSGLGLVIELKSARVYDANKLMSEAPEAMGNVYQSLVVKEVKPYQNELEMILHNSVSLKDNINSASLVKWDRDREVPRFVRSIFTADKN